VNAGNKLNKEASEIQLLLGEPEEFSDQMGLYYENHYKRQRRAT